MIQLYLLVSIAVAGLILGLIYRIRIWFSGKGKTTKLPLFVLLSIPKRYFVDLHHVAMRDKPMAYTHVMVAGGTVLLALLAVLYITLGAKTQPLQWLAPLACLIILCGCCYLYIKRRKKPIRFSYKSFKTMPPSLLLFALGLTFILVVPKNITDAQTYLWIAFGLSMIGVIDIFWSGLLNRPFKHIVAGALHLAYHPRQERFKGKRSTAIQPMEQTDTSKYGVGQAKDFNWRQILGFDACIECGRCQEVCPAFAAEQPLNPKKLIQDCLLAATGGDDLQYSGANYPGENSSKKISGANATITPDFITQETLYACTTCRACVEACPMFIEHVDAIVDMRRHLVMDSGNIPGNCKTALSNLRYTNTVGGYNCNKRANWATDLNIPFASADEPCQLLLLSGEGGFDLRHQLTLRSLARLIQKSGAGLALLENEPDGGDLMRRLGDETGFRKLADNLANRLQGVQFEQIVTCDPHLYNLLANEYPQLGYSFKVVHHSELLNKLITEKKLKTSPLNRKTTYHDPCYLGRYNNLINPPRDLLHNIGVEIIEMEKSAMRARCCGWGGGAAYSDIPGKQRIPDMRMDDVKATKADNVTVACPNCMTMLEGVITPRPDVIDIVELVAEACE